MNAAASLSLQHHRRAFLHQRSDSGGELVATPTQLDWGRQSPKLTDCECTARGDGCGEVAAGKSNCCAVVMLIFLKLAAAPSISVRNVMLVLVLAEMNQAMLALFV